MILMAARSAWAMVRELRTRHLRRRHHRGDGHRGLRAGRRGVGGAGHRAHAHHRSRRSRTTRPIARSGTSRSCSHAIRRSRTGCEPMARSRRSPVSGVVPGDQVLVRAERGGARRRHTRSIRAGVFDESSLTGESLPVEKIRGDEVLSGSVNGSAAVVLEVDPGREGQPVPADRRPRRERGEQQGADRAARRSIRAARSHSPPTPSRALAWWLSGDPARFAEVLVVATPCPLIIAAPVAFMAGMSRAARDGIIIRSSATLEKLHRVRAFAFDKTGTLTRGEPTLVDVRPEEDIVAGELCSASPHPSKPNSTHTLARATAAWCRRPRPHARSDPTTRRSDGQRRDRGRGRARRRRRQARLHRAARRTTTSRRLRSAAARWRSTSAIDGDLRRGARLPR